MEHHEGDYHVTVKEFSNMLNISDKIPYSIFKSKPDLLPHTTIKRKKYISADSIHRYKQHKDIVPKMLNGVKILSLYNAKGGVGKTLTTTNFAIKAVIEGMKVLVIDMDMQANVTKTFGINNPRERDTFLNIIKGESTIHETIIPISPTLHLIPSNVSFAKLDGELDFKEGFGQIKAPLNEVRDEYDLVIIDCAPSMSNINFATICASDMVISPAFPDAYSEEGLELTCETIEKAKNRGFSPIHKILLNKIHMREKSSQSYFVKYTSAYENKMTSTALRVSADAVNSINKNKSIFEENPNSGIADDISALFYELTGQKNPKENCPEGVL